MFCSNCGKKMDKSRKFCSFCGAENLEYSSATIVEKRANAPIALDGNGGFNREVLINYLGNLQTLEMVKKDLLTQKVKIEKKISGLGKPQKYRDRLSFFECGNRAGIFILAVLAYVIAAWLESVADGVEIFSLIAQLLFPFLAPIKTIAAIVALVCAGSIIYTCVKDGIRYKEDKQWEERRLNREQAEIVELRKKIPPINQDIQKINEVLRKAYSINVIPFNCRNIYGVYFLYDYLTTSMATLSEALLHFDLDKITQQLDRVIHQQQEQILQIARNNALNQQLIMQNEEMIQRAIAIEENTALAAQYAEVAAVNTETMATIQAVHFWYDVSKR